MRSYAAFALALSLCVSQNPGAQQNPQVPQQPVFRSGVDFVRVDVYPRHRDRIVEGLTKEDFQLTEDNVRQTIETFEYIPISMDRDLEPLDPRSPSEARRMAEDPRNRVFVFYLDTYEITMEGSWRSREPLLEFLQRSMGPRDLFAWMTPKQSPEFLEFTRATQDLATLMSIARPWGQKDTPVDDPEEMKLQACEPGPARPPGAPNSLVKMKRDIDMHTDLKELIIRLGALRQERKNLVILGERWHNRTDDPFAPRFGRGPAAPAASGLRFQRGRGSFEPKSPTMDAFRQCDQMRQYLRGQVVFERAQQLIDLARRNNVALYFVSLAPVSLFNFSVAGTFADETDGKSFVSNDISASLSRVLEHQTGFYMLGYRSTAGEAGKKARQVRVRTTKSGVDLDVRRIYDPPPPEFLAARNAPKPPVERTDVEKAIDRLPVVRDEAELFVQAIRRATSVEVSVELAGRIAASTPWNAGGKVTASVRDEAGAVLATAEGAVVAGERGVRVVIPVADQARAARAAVVLTHGTGITLGDGIAIGPADPGAIGTPVFSRAGSLPRLPFVPAAEMSFGRTERVRIEWPIAANVVEPKIRVLNSVGAELPADAVVAVNDSPRAVRADVRLLSFAPGAYVVEISNAADGAPVRLLTAIRVTR